MHVQVIKRSNTLIIRGKWSKLGVESKMFIVGVYNDVKKGFRFYNLETIFILSVETCSLEDLTPKDNVGVYN